MKTLNRQALPLPPQQAFEAWFAPQTMVALGLKAAEIDARQGGAFAFHTHQGHVTSGTFLEFAPERTVQTWSVRSPDGTSVESTVVTAFSAAPGGSELTISEEGAALSTPEARRDGEAAWAAVMSAFAGVLDARS